MGRQLYEYRQRVIGTALYPLLDCVNSPGVQVAAATDDQWLEQEGYEWVGAGEDRVLQFCDEQISSSSDDFAARFCERCESFLLYS